MKHLPFATLPDMPAFPLDPGVSEADPNNGLTKREYFAAVALEGLVAGETVPTFPAMAHMAVQAADALIEALNLAQLNTHQLIDPDDTDDHDKPLE